MFLCELCGKQFTRKTNLHKHSTTKHGGEVLDYNCTICKKRFAERQAYNTHISKHLNSEKWNLFRSAFNGTTKIFRKKLDKTTSFLGLSLIKKDILQLLKTQLLIYPKLKMSISVLCEYSLHSENVNVPQIEEFTLKSNNKIVTVNRRKELERHISNCFNQIQSREDGLNMRESGWKLETILFIDIHLTQVNILL